MRRYLPNPFASSTTPQPETPTDNETSNIKATNNVNNVNDTNEVPSPSPDASPTHSPRHSYVPSLPIQIPSMRKYLFSSTSSNTPPSSTSLVNPTTITDVEPTTTTTTTTSTNPDVAVTTTKVIHDEDVTITDTTSTHPIDETTNTNVNITTSPTSSISSTPKSQNNASSATTSLTSESTLLSSALHELTALVDKAIGPVGHISDNTLAKRLPNDRLLSILNHSVSDRNRILMQFLRARQHNAAEAMAMISNALRWRKTMDIDLYLRDTKRNMTCPMACFPMHVISSSSSCKQPVVYGLIRLLDKRKAERHAFQKALLSFLESSYFGECYISDEMIIILDFRDWSIRKNAPYRLVKDGIQTLQEYYPERLGRVFLVNYPTTIRAAYTAISPIIDAGAKEKIVWVGTDPDPAITLRKYISPKSIPSFLGGELHATFPSTWPDIAKEFADANAAKGSSSHSFFHH